MTAVISTGSLVISTERSEWRNLKRDLFHFTGEKVKTVIRKTLDAGGGKPDVVGRLVRGEGNHPLAVPLDGFPRNVGVRNVLEVRNRRGLQGGVGGEDAFQVIVRRLPGAVVFQGGPGRSGPDVVELPHQDAIAFRQGAPPGRRCLQPDGLLQLREVDDGMRFLDFALRASLGMTIVISTVPLVISTERSERRNLKQVPHPLQHVLIPTIFPHPGFLLFQRRKKTGEAGMPEFGHEAGPILIILAQRPGVLGNVPEVHVAFGILFPAVGLKVSRAAAGRSGPIEPFRIQRSHQVSPQVHESPVFGHVQLRILLPDALVVIVYAFIVPAPERDGRMALQPPNLMGDFPSHLSQELVRSGVHGAGEHEVVPDEKAQGVAEVIEAVLFELPAAPEADHVHIRIPGRCQQLPVPLRRLSFFRDVAGDPVGPQRLHGPAVHLESEVLPHLKGAEADILCERLAIGLYGGGIKRLVPHTGGPPEPGPADGEALPDGVDALGEPDLAAFGLLPEGEGDIGLPAFRGSDLSDEGHRDAAARMLLRAAEVVQPGHIHRNQLHRTGKARVHALGSPVPAALIDGLPD